MSAAVEVLAALLLVGGALVVALAALGIARLPDPFSRMHAAAKAGVAGAGMLLLGAGLAFGSAGAILTALAAVAFLVMTAPLASHALGRAAYVAGAPLGAAGVADALSGVLRRGVFDIDPARNARSRPAAREPHAKDPSPMTALPEFRRPAEPRGAAAAAPAPMAARRVLCCLLGGPYQARRPAQALALAQAAGAQVTGLSGAGVAPQVWRGPLPLGGAFWAEWQASRSRARLREAASAALTEFQAMAALTPGLDCTARHEEGIAAPELARLFAGHDLAVLPAEAGPHGLPAAPDEEVAASLARARILPVLRVRRQVGQVRAVLIPVGSSPACAGLAPGLIRSGLWQSAAVTILPIADDRRGVREMVEASAELLRSHGRRVNVAAAIDLDFETDDLLPRLARFEAAVLPCLSTRHGGFFDSIRNCAFETVSERVPLVLLP